MDKKIEIEGLNEQQVAALQLSALEMQRENLDHRIQSMKKGLGKAAVPAVVLQAPEPKSPAREVNVSPERPYSPPKRPRSGRRRGKDREARRRDVMVVVKKHIFATYQIGALVDPRAVAKALKCRESSVRSALEAFSWVTVPNQESGAPHERAQRRSANRELFIEKKKAPNGRVQFWFWDEWQKKNQAAKEAEVIRNQIPVQHQLQLVPAAPDTNKELLGSSELH